MDFEEKIKEQKYITQKPKCMIEKIYIYSRNKETYTSVWSDPAVTDWEVTIRGDMI